MTKIYYPDFENKKLILSLEISPRGSLEETYTMEDFEETDLEKSIRKCEEALYGESDDEDFADPKE
jgi:hypothetical protein